MDDTYKPFNFKPIMKLATRPEKRIGEDALWDKAESDTENGTLDYRIRKAQLEKVPFVIVIR